MTSRKMAAAVLAATMTGAFGMSGCATPQDPESPPPAPSSSAAGTTALLQLNDALRAQLGDAYADAWIEGNQLHVAVTTKAAATIVAAAGAVAKLVRIDAAQLEAALQAVSAWRATLPPEQATAIHSMSTDGSAGTLTLFVAPDQLDAVARAAATDKPAGEVPLIIRESSGLATPL